MRDIFLFLHTKKKFSIFHYTYKFTELKKTTFKSIFTNFKHSNEMPRKRSSIRNLVWLLLAACSLTPPPPSQFLSSSIFYIHAKLATGKAQRLETTTKYEVKMWNKKRKEKSWAKRRVPRKATDLEKKMMIPASGILKPDWPVALHSLLSQFPPNTEKHEIKK